MPAARSECEIDLGLDRDSSLYQQSAMSNISRGAHRGSARAGNVRGFALGSIVPHRGQACCCRLFLHFSQNLESLSYKNIPVM